MHVDHFLFLTISRFNCIQFKGMVNALLLVFFICVPRDLSGVIVVKPSPNPAVILEMGDIQLRQSFRISMFIITGIFNTLLSSKSKVAIKIISTNSIYDVNQWKIIEGENISVGREVFLPHDYVLTRTLHVCSFLGKLFLIAVFVILTSATSMLIRMCLRGRDNGIRQSKSKWVKLDLFNSCRSP